MNSCVNEVSNFGMQLVSPLVDVGPRSGLNHSDPTSADNEPRCGSNQSNPDVRPYSGVGHANT